MRTYKRVRFICFLAGALFFSESTGLADMIVRRPSADVMEVSCWAGGVALTSRQVVCEGVVETRPFVELEGAEPDYSLFGAPALPFVKCRILLPPFKAVDSLRISGRGDCRQFDLSGPLAFINRPYTGYDMTDPEQARAWAENNREDTAIYSADAWYPANPVLFTRRNFRGYAILELQFTPFQYNPARNALQFAGHTTLSMRLKKTDGADAVGCRDLESDRSMVRRMVVNPGQADEYLTRAKEAILAGAPLKGEGEPAPLGASNEYYVIITAAAFTNSFKPLRDFHSYDAEHQAGIVSVEDIYAQDSDTNKIAFLKIHDYIMTVLYSNGTDYVLLGGDTNIVPSWYGAPDFYFGDGQIPVGRFTFDTAEQLSNCIAKAMRAVSNGTDKVLLLPRADEIGGSVLAYTNYFLPYLSVDIDGTLYNGEPSRLYPAMDSHTILWARGHGYYLYPQWGPSWSPPSNTNIRPVGVNFGCSGAKFQMSDPEHPAELYQTGANGNAAYIGATEDVTYNTFDAAFFSSYFVEGTVGPRVGDMALVARLDSPYYTLLGDPLYEIVSPQFQAMPRIRTPGESGYSRSYNIDQGSGAIEEVLFRVVSFNDCGWAITNLSCDSVLSNRLAFSCLQSNRTADVRLQFGDVTNIPPDSYTIRFDVRDTTNGFYLQQKTATLIVTDKNILSDEDFTYDGNRKILPPGDYILAGDLVVESGVALVLQPGVLLHGDGEFGSGWKIVVQAGGRMESRGTVTNPISFADPFGSQAVSIELSGTEFMPLTGAFEYCLFAKDIVGTNAPAVNFVNCTFLLSMSMSTLFPRRVTGVMKNCLISTCNFGMPARIGDLSGLNISYSCVPPQRSGFDAPYPSFHTHGEEMVWGNEFLAMSGWKTPTLISTCVNAGDPASPLDPDGTRADLGAFYHDLSRAIRVPGEYEAIQDAINAAALATTAVIVAGGEYYGSIRFPSATEQGVRLMGESETNRPVMVMTNNPGDLISYDGNAFIENFVIRNVGSNGTGRAVYLGKDMLRVGFRNCEFSGNSNNSEVFCVAVTNYFNGLTLSMYDVDFVNNASNTEVLHIGEGLWNMWMEPWNWLKDCRFTNNTDCGVVFSYSPTNRYLFTHGLTFLDNHADTVILNSAASTTNDPVLELRNSLICNNVGDMRTENGGNTLFESCTFYNNASNVVAAGRSRLELRNSIFWDNAASILTSDTATVIVDYTDINASYPGGGTGNLSTNPLFADSAAGNYHLRHISPCIDAGDPQSDYPNEPEPNGNRINMGRYGNTPEAAVWELSIPAGIRLAGAGDDLRLDFAAQSNRWYRLEFTRSLFEPWTNSLELMATGDLVEITCPIDGDQGFYRIFNYSP